MSFAAVQQQLHTATQTMGALFSRQPTADELVQTNRDDLFRNIQAKAALAAKLEAEKAALEQRMRSLSPTQPEARALFTRFQRVEADIRAAEADRRLFETSLATLNKSHEKSEQLQTIQKTNTAVATVQREMQTTLGARPERVIADLARHQQRTDALDALLQQGLGDLDAGAAPEAADVEREMAAWQARQRQAMLNDIPAVPATVPQRATANVKQQQQQQPVDALLDAYMNKQ